MSVPISPFRLREDFKPPLESDMIQIYFTRN